MTCQTHTQNLKAYAALLLIGLFITGCDQVPSVDIPTDEVYVDYSVDAYEAYPTSMSAWFYTYENQADSTAPLGSLLNRINIDLSPEETGVATVNGVNYPMVSIEDQYAEVRDDPETIFLFITRPIWYVLAELGVDAFGAHLSATTPSSSTGDEVTFTFNRASGEVLQSFVRVGQFPVITSPFEGSTITSDVNEFTVSWEELIDVEVPVKLHVSVRCVEDFTWTENDYQEMEELATDIQNDHTGSVNKDIDVGVTSFLVLREELMQDVIVPDGVTRCGGTITLSYSKEGALAAEFSGGSVDVVHNAEKVTFLFDL